MPLQQLKLLLLLHLMHLTKLLAPHENYLVSCLVIFPFLQPCLCLLGADLALVDLDLQGVASCP